MNHPRRTLRIAAVGDIMLDRDVGRHFREQPNDFALPEIAKIFRDYDIVLGNLENPVGLRGAPHPKQDPHVAFRCHPDTLQALKNLGIGVVTLANNHMLDYGPETLLDTQKHLDDAAIGHFGAGRDYDEANSPYLAEVNGIPVAILGSVFIYSASTEKASARKPGVADYQIGKLIRKIRRLKQAGRVVIVTVHWGIEYCFYPIPYQAQQARRMIDAGASLVIGHGPHYAQGIEKYRAGEIVYSLGNFIFDEPMLYSKRGFIYGATLDDQGEIISNQIHPFHIDNHLPQLYPSPEKQRLSIAVKNFSIMYGRKDKAFWKNINNLWLQDIVMRVFKMKSLKFIALPPPSFYLSIGMKNILRKVNINNLAWVVKQSINKLRSAPAE